MKAKQADDELIKKRQEVDVKLRGIKHNNDRIQEKINKIKQAFSKIKGLRDDGLLI